MGIAKPNFSSQHSHRSIEEETFPKASKKGGSFNTDKEFSGQSKLETMSIDCNQGQSNGPSKKSPWSDQFDLIVSNFPKMDKNLDGYIDFENLSETIKRTSAFLNKLYRSDVRDPHIAPHDEDSILLEWYYPSFEIIVYINSMGEFDFCLATIDKGENMEYESFESEDEDNCVNTLNKWFSMILKQQRA